MNLSGTLDNVDLIYNGLSDTHETLFPYIEDAANDGSLTLLTKEQLGDRQVERPYCTTGNKQVKSYCSTGNRKIETYCTTGKRQVETYCTTQEIDR
jgi:hypothetical protein